jgi:ribosomal protein L44E
MPRIFCITLVAFMVMMVAPASGQKPTPLKTFMRAKLDHSKNLLEAITTENYDAMAKEAQEMALLTLVEQWQVFETSEYQQHSREFRRTADAIKEAAEKKNLDGAALAYVELTMKCVNCHKYVKKERTAGIELKTFEHYALDR